MLDGLPECGVSPGSKRDEIVGWREDVLRVRVRAALEKGKANDALCALIAAATATSKRSVVVERGHTSRDKLVLVNGLTDTHASLRGRIRDHPAQLTEIRPASRSDIHAISRIMNYLLEPPSATMLGTDRASRLGHPGESRVNLKIEDSFVAVTDGKIVG